MLNCKRINSLHGCAHGIAQRRGLKINICEKRKKQHRWVFQHRNLPRIKGLWRWQPELWNQSRNVQGSAVLVLLALPALELASWLWQSRTAWLRPRSSRKDEVVLPACLLLGWVSCCPKQLCPKGSGCPPASPTISWSYWLNPSSINQKNDLTAKQHRAAAHCSAGLSLGLLCTALETQRLYRLQLNDHLFVYLYHHRAPCFTNKGLMNQNSRSYVYLLLLQSVTINLDCWLTASRWIS